jgi:hypothetical protein
MFFSVFSIVSGAFHNFTNRDNMLDFAKGVKHVKKFCVLWRYALDQMLIP